MTELEKLYILRTKAIARKDAANHNITTSEKHIIELQADIRSNRGEMMMADYFLDYINKFIAELEGVEK
jgi:hypothetical protein